MAAEMTEKQKMLAGELYYSGGPELTAEREKAHNAAFKYNSLRTTDPANCTPENLVCPWSTSETPHRSGDVEFDLGFRNGL